MSTRNRSRSYDRWPDSSSESSRSSHSSESSYEYDSCSDSETDDSQCTEYYSDCPVNKQPPVRRFPMTPNNCNNTPHHSSHPCNQNLVGAPAPTPPPPEKSDVVKDYEHSQTVVYTITMIFYLGLLIVLIGIVIYLARNPPFIRSHCIKAPDTYQRAWEPYKWPCGNQDMYPDYMTSECNGNSCPIPIAVEAQVPTISEL